MRPDLTLGHGVTAPLQEALKNGGESRRFRPATGAAGGEVLQPPSPVAGATAERSPVVADDPVDVILVEPTSR